MISSNSRALIVREATVKDNRALMRVLEENWAVHTRILPDQLKQRLAHGIALIAEDKIAIRGFLMVEEQPPDGCLLICAAVHDNKEPLNILAALLPQLEANLQEHGFKSITHIGEMPWLTRELANFDFKLADEIVTLEWQRQPLPAMRPQAGLEIRAATINDLPSLLELDQVAFTALWRKPRTSFLEALSQAISFSVGIIDDQIIAYEWCDHFGGRVHLTRLATHPAFQGQGIGKQLLHHALEAVTATDATSITLNTQKSNIRSQDLYRRFGFRDTGEVIGVYWKSLDVRN